MVGGVFNTVDMLPDWLRWLAWANPFFYFINGIRGAMIGFDETPPGLGIGLTLVLLAGAGRHGLAALCQGLWACGNRRRLRLSRRHGSGILAPGRKPIQIARFRRDRDAASNSGTVMNKSWDFAWFPLRPAVGRCPPLADPANLLGVFGNWTAYSTGTGTSLTCYALSKPRATQPAAPSAATIYLMVSDWPGRKVKAEPQIVPGYQYKEGGAVALGVGSDKFTFFARNDGKNGSAWLQ